MEKGLFKRQKAHDLGKEYMRLAEFFQENPSDENDVNYFICDNLILVPGFELESKDLFNRLPLHVKRIMWREKLLLEFHVSYKDREPKKAYFTQLRKWYGKTEDQTQDLRLRNLVYALFKGDEELFFKMIEDDQANDQEILKRCDRELLPRMMSAVEDIEAMSIFEKVKRLFALTNLPCYSLHLKSHNNVIGK